MEEKPQYDSSQVDGNIPRVAQGEEFLVHGDNLTVYTTRRAGMVLSGVAHPDRFRAGALLFIRGYFWRVASDPENGYVAVVPHGRSKRGLVNDKGVLREAPTHPRRYR